MVDSARTLNQAAAVTVENALGLFILVQCIFINRILLEIKSLVMK